MMNGISSRLLIPDKKGSASDLGSILDLEYRELPTGRPFVSGRGMPIKTSPTASIAKQKHDK
jgi:hypothetical protein